jgi:hypothetical protein
MINTAHAHCKILPETEWKGLTDWATDKFNADRFVAIRPGGSSNSTETHVVWETTRGLSEIASALFYRGR